MANKAKFYLTKAFKKLDKKWKAKLAKSGFEDAEQDDGMLKNWDSSVRLRYDTHKFASIEEYFRLAGHFLHEYSFISECQKKMWEMHANGTTINEISSFVRKKYPKEYSSNTTIFREIEKLKKEMLKRYDN